MIGANKGCVIDRYNTIWIYISCDDTFGRKLRYFAVAYLLRESMKNLYFLIKQRSLILL